CQQGFDTPFTF
nr:immunoglobulin light chain junction region [Macaca mulatta]MOW09470.1 immunoglobulin light chain junction region [Macaca mulatta]MOW09473.1 immunoglobulin light chain junction region [Macaca mulatta]MOW09605.1 immunoglobulin light chain junction region [Macaca mulatta]MOW09807.1 immunoglobulin light chain junction region [Macaca mulatta]